MSIDTCNFVLSNKIEFGIKGLFGSTYLSLYIGINTCETV